MCVSVETGACHQLFPHARKVVNAHLHDGFRPKSLVSTQYKMDPSIPGEKAGPLLNIERLLCVAAALSMVTLQDFITFIVDKKGSKAILTYKAHTKSQLAGKSQEGMIVSRTNNAGTW